MLPTRTTLGQSFAAVLTGLRAIVAAVAAKSPLRVPMLVLVYNRLGRMAARLDRLAERWQSGTLPKPRPSRAGRSRPAPRQACPLPNGHAWLIRIAQPTAQLAGQVQAFLARPDAQALIEAAPQAGRILRPLCRMLGLDPPPCLRRPPPPPTTTQTAAEPATRRRPAEAPPTHAPTRAVAPRPRARAPLPPWHAFPV